ncbi:hypothetical protein GIB67_033273 [Kingdonia uniflora]|uniref:Uncharacterized protein n=1 Tax=Kingdonia uniflora TaxID=39325 RepID=A0A7J7MPN7_9MAGN|nr:hypothetical protein GIB67_033273 [Kingdonia uniflora]
MAMKKLSLFDCHCHLQDPRIRHVYPQLIQTALDSGVLRFGVNGVSEGLQKDWEVVKQMSEEYPNSVIPCFGLHPWYVGEKTPNWFNTLRGYFDSTPSAAVGEIGLDKGSHGKEIDFAQQVLVFQQQLQLAKDLHRPASIHCVRAFADLLQIMQYVILSYHYYYPFQWPFPAGVILHSYLGSAEMVPGFAKLGAYFSFSGFLMSMKPQKAKKMLKSIPTERILLESDSPDALPRSNLDALLWVPGDQSVPQELQRQGDTPNVNIPDHQPHVVREALNHPANIHNVLSYVASMLEMSIEELAEISYRNTMGLFSYPGSKIDLGD